MRKTVMLILVLLLMTFFGVGCGSDTQKSVDSTGNADEKKDASSTQITEEVIIAAEDAASPWSNPDGTGYANDVVAAAFKASSFPVKTMVVPYARGKVLAMEGHVAACFSMSKEAALEKDILFPETPLFTLDTGIYIKKGKTLPYKHLDSIPRGTTLGIVNGYEYPTEVTELASLGIVFNVVNDEQTIIKMIVAERMVLGVINCNEIKNIAGVEKSAGVPSGSISLLFPIGTSNSYIGFSKASPYGEKAKEAFDRGMKLIAESGELQQIKEKWEKAPMP